MLRQKRQQQQSKPIRWGLKKICWGLINITVPRHAPRSWIEANFQKRDCVKFIPFAKDETRCCCGQARATHPTIAGIEAGSPGDVWVPFKHTRSHPTDAYGTIEFQGGAHPTKAQYVRLSYDTRPELLVQLFTKEWNLELPKLLISVQGGKANFELQPKLKKEIRKGLLKAAKTTGAWVFTGGTNTGVTKQVGDALLLEGQQKTGRVVSIGIAPWGIVERNHELLGHNRDVPCHSISSPRSKLAVLNNRHAYFLLVDNGSQGRYGAELILRRKLEKFISNLKLYPFTHSSTPVVCLVIEGGTNTIRAVLEYVTDSPPVPVVVCDGSGRAADIIAFAHKKACEEEEQMLRDPWRENLIVKIKSTFEVTYEQAERLFQEVVQCVRNKNLITVYRIQEKADGGGETQELDQTILTALFKSQHLSPSEQLSLALTWNRVDIARTEIFIYGQEWQHGALDEAMMRALEHDRIDFVKLLLENGVSMKKFLTIPRLEELYNTKHGPANTMGYILRDVRPHIPRGYVYTLHDIGLVINKLMGGAYRSYYTRRKFRPIYAKVMNSYVNTYRKSSTFQRHPGANSMSLVTGLLPFTSEMALFQFPFNELLIWAVLTKRQEMALLMWEHGEEALAKSLVACKLYKAMAHEAAEDDLDTEIYDELKSYAKDFEAKGIRLLDFCYRQDADRAQRLLTCELQSWSSQSCLSLAVAANHRPLLAHSCSQVILADLWMGGLRTRKNTNLKVILGLLCPPFIMKLDFKSKEELQSMPQTEEEHIENQNLDYEDLEKTNPDAENPMRRRKSISSKYDIGRQSSTQALLAETYPMKDTKVQENGKVSLTDTDPNQRENQHILFDFDDYKQHRPLRLKKKVYEFYTAPITKFWADSIAYMLFLVIFTYTVLVKMSPTPSWQEIYCIAYITTLGCEKVREIISSEPVAVTHKFSVWAWNMWNPCDAAAIIFFLIGLTLRFKTTTMDIGRVFYCVDSVYWYLRILNILGVNKYLGPLVTMMGKMVKNMIYFVVLLLVVLLSFGVSRQAILYSEREPSWLLVKDVFYQPYFMLYGEVFADDIDPPCGESADQQPCVVARPIAIIMMSLFLLVANILLINLLIAVFNNIFIEVNAVSHQVWMFQRFTVVMQYQQKPVLPPPLIAVSHCYSLFKFLMRKAKGLDLPRDNGLKLFLEKDDMERLYDFEEECVEGYVREQEVVLQQSTDERIRATNDRVEHMTQKVEDHNQKQNVQFGLVQQIDYRLRNLEESCEAIQSTLTVIHRFMSVHTSMQDGLHGSSSNLSSEFRARAVSDAADQRKTIDVDASQTAAAAAAAIAGAVAAGASQQQQTPAMVAAAAAAVADVETVAERIAGTAAALRLQHQDTASTASKDTLTAHDDEHTLVDDESVENITHLNFDAARQKALRRRSVYRRNSETYDLNRSQSSLNTAGGMMARRQRSLTQSEPDSGNEQSSTAKTVITVKQTRGVLMKLHSEYTSITDELENVCQLIASPTLSHDTAGGGVATTATGGTTSINTSDERAQYDGSATDPTLAHLSKAAIAALLERKHLKECEEDDYMILSKLFNDRYTDSDEYALGVEDEATAGASSHLSASLELPAHRRAALRRDAAVELPATPVKSTTAGEPPPGLMMGHHHLYQPGGGPPPYAHLTAHSADASTTQPDRHTAPGQFLIPSLSEPSPSRLLYRNSGGFGGLGGGGGGGGLGATVAPSDGQRGVLRHQTSSTDTEEYTLHPYRVIKQSSNDTNASLNEELAYVSNESLNRYGQQPAQLPQPGGGGVTGGTGMGTGGHFVQPHPPARPPPPLCFGAKELALGVVVSAATSAVVIAMPPPLTGLGTGSGRVLLESSSTSTEEEQTRVLPRISTHLVQDEIAQMSSNIGDSREGSSNSSSNSSADGAAAGERKPGEKKASDASYTETMC